MSEIIKEAMKQDFSSHAVLGRVLFGISFLVLGLYSILNAKMLASYGVPDFVPDALNSLVVLAVGVVFVAGGFGIAVNRKVEKSSKAIAGVWILMAIFVHLLGSSIDIVQLFQSLAFIGAALLIGANAEEAPKPSAPTPPESEHSDSHSSE